MKVNVRHLRLSLYHFNFLKIRSMKKNTIFYLCFLSIMFSSCYIKGLTNGYKQLTDAEKGLVHFNTNKNISKYSDTIFAYNGSDFKKTLLQNNKTVVYKWSANCSSKSCIPLTASQYFCDKNGYELVVLLEYFDLQKQRQLGMPLNALIMADFKYYQTNIADKSTSLFIKDLTNFNLKDTTIGYKRFLFFEKDKFVKAEENLY